MMDGGEAMYLETTDWQGWRIVSVGGMFVVKSLTEIRRLFESIEREGCSMVALDLTNASHMDSSAITIMLNFQKRLLAGGGRMVVYGPNEDIRGIFSIVGFDSTVPVYGTRQEFERIAQA